MLGERGIDFDAFMLDDVDPAIKDELITQAKEKKLMVLPIVVRDGQVIDFKEV